MYEYTLWDNERENVHHDITLNMMLDFNTLYTMCYGMTFLAEVINPYNIKFCIKCVISFLLTYLNYNMTYY